MQGGKITLRQKTEFISSDNWLIVFQKTNTYQVKRFKPFGTINTIHWVLNYFDFKSVKIAIFGSLPQMFL